VQLRSESRGLCQCVKAEHHRSRGFCGSPVATIHAARLSQNVDQIRRRDQLDDGATQGMFDELGHESMAVTVNSYLPVTTERQMEIIGEMVAKS